NGKTISIGTTNVVKSIPQGYVVVSGNSSNNKNHQLICLDKKDPTKLLWRLELNQNSQNIEILGVEYTPYDGGRLVVLYSEEDPNYGSYTNIPVKQIKFKVFNFKNNFPSLLFSGNGGSYATDSQHGAGPGGRLDTWAITPIFNFDKEVNKYLIYCRDQYFNQYFKYSSNEARETFYLIDLTKSSTNNGENCKPILTMWEAPQRNGSYVNTYTGNKKTILSIAAFEKENIVYSLPLIIDFDDKKLELGLYRVQKDYDDRPYPLGIEKSSRNWVYNVLITRNHIQLNEIEINEQIFSSSSNEKDYQKAADLAKGSISSYSFKITNDGKLKVCFVINISPNGTNFSPHRGAKFVLIEIDKNKDITYSIKNLFSNNHDLLSEDELWHGYFVNDVITKHGINSTLNNENLTPFVGVGWSQKRLGDSYPWFVWLVKNPFSKSNDYNFNPHTNSNDFRVYCVNGGINNNQVYPGSINSHSQYGLSQFNVGFPILEYDENKNDSSFNRNILFTWNNQQKAIVINQKNYKSFQAPTLGYYTRLKVNKNSFSYSDLGLSSNDFSRLTKDDIKNRIKNNLLLNNISNSIHTFDKLFFDYENGQIIFTLKINNYFNQQGQLKTDNNFKLENITITGLTTIKYQISTAIQNLYNSTYTDYKNRNSSVFIASEIFSHNSQTNNELYWSLREIVWRLVTKNKLGLKLKKTIGFGSNQQQTRTNFNSFFKSFSWTKYNNKKGEITAIFSINKDYLYVDESQDDKSFTITFNGLRKIEDTKLKSNNKDNAITDSALSSFNIPHNGTILDQQYDYLSPETKV
ncbi:MAG: hypothetical protein IKJ72_00905, partial [Mycoplasmataceae bacterium]|nr:hypothetical protein [Mycoplasmataceae bacterium]